jgi:DNA-binding transcriptional regulator GbsR (MarR family)
MLLGIAQDKVTEERNPTASRRPFSDLEAEIIGLFVQISRIIGQPRSYAEIYAVLFMSPDPLTMEELIARLGISRGSASQGLSFLRKAGAIRMVLIPGRRPAHYEAVAELRQLVAGFLRDQVLPQVEESQNRLSHIVEMVGGMPAKDRDHVSRRISMLQSWGKRSRQFLPLVLKMLGT